MRVIRNPNPRVSEYISAHYTEQSAIEMAKALNVNVCTIREYALYLKIKLKKHVSLRNKRVNDRIKIILANPKLSTPQLAEKLGIDARVLSAFCSQRKLRSKPKRVLKVKQAEPEDGILKYNRHAFENLFISMT